MGKDEKVKGERISAEDYWRLRDAGKHLDKVREEYQKWLRKRARKENCYVDQIKHVLTGKIVLDPTKEWPAGEVKRASDKFIEDAEPMFSKVEKAVDEFNNLCDEIARAYGTRVDLLDHKTGKIAADDSVEAIKTDAVPGKKKKVTKES